MFKLASLVTIYKNDLIFVSCKFYVLINIVLREMKIGMFKKLKD